MYVPNHFKEDSVETLQQHIRDYSFGLLVIADDAGIEANHVPFYLDMNEEGSLGTLQCHLARSNLVWQRIEKSRFVLAVSKVPMPMYRPHGIRARQRLGVLCQLGTIWLCMSQAVLKLFRTLFGLKSIYVS